MADRYNHLFPKDKQPEPGTPFMYIRKEVQYLIKPFDFKRLALSNEIFPVDQIDTELIEKIEKLDGFIENSADYSSYEDLLYSLHNDCRERFEKWLAAKGLKEDIQDLSFCLETYLNFIYGYHHDDIVVLKSVSDVYFLEFFEDYLLRKMMEAIEIELEKCYITNLIKCEVKDSLTRPGLMFKNCEPILKKEIYKFKPKTIIVMVDDTPIKKIINENIKINYYNMDHPVTLIKTPKLKRTAWEVLQKAGIQLKKSSSND